jgi:hypothetical protein
VITFSRNLRQMAPRLAQEGTASAPTGGSGSPTAVMVRVDAPAAMPRLLAPRAVMMCQLVMSVAMGYMLLSLL